MATSLVPSKVVSDQSGRVVFPVTGVEAQNPAEMPREDLTAAVEPDQDRHQK